LRSRSDMVEFPFVGPVERKGFAAPVTKSISDTANC
jgi:hypothetical protein